MRCETFKNEPTNGCMVCKCQISFGKMENTGPVACDTLWISSAQAPVCLTKRSGAWVAQSPPRDFTNAPASRWKGLTVYGSIICQPEQPGDATVKAKLIKPQ